MIINQSGGGSDNLTAELNQQDTLLLELEEILNTKISALSEDLSAELNTQDSLIEQINAALDGKAGSQAGSQLETCDLEIKVNMCSVRIFYTTIVDGQIVTKNDDVSSNSSIQILCNSIFYVDKDSTVYIANANGIKSLYNNYLFEMLPYDESTASIQFIREPELV